MVKKSKIKDDYRILHQSSEWIAVHKPAGLLSIPDRYDKSLPNLHSILESIYGKVYPIHRLDKDTSGVLIFALSSQANKYLSDQFSKKLVEKVYLALVRGIPTAPYGEINAPIAEDLCNKGLVKVDFRKGKPSITKWELIENFKFFSLLRVFPLTGRQHQIRVHLKYINLPLAVDAEYGGGSAIYLSEIKQDYKKSKFTLGETPLLDRLSLHAYSIKFLPPGADSHIEIIDPLPNDFEVALKQLKKWSEKAK